jgi:hypothetical protein
MGKKRVLCSYGIDIDAVAGWLGSYGGEDSTNDISRGRKLHACEIKENRAMIIQLTHHRTVCRHDWCPSSVEAPREE